MPRSTELLALARRLCDTSDDRLPSRTDLSRAVSSAYYAVFRALLWSAAQRFNGPGLEGTAAYSIIYRSFEHRHVRTVCEALQGTTLKERLRRQLNRTSMSQDIQDFARAFPPLQDARHLADYDPVKTFTPSAVTDWINVAEAAIDAFNRADPQEQTDVLALMMVRSRD